MHMMYMAYMRYTGYYFLDSFKFYSCRYCINGHFETVSQQTPGACKNNDHNYKTNSRVNPIKVCFAYYNARNNDA